MLFSVLLMLLKEAKRLRVGNSISFGDLALRCDGSIGTQSLLGDDVVVEVVVVGIGLLFGFGVTARAAAIGVADVM